MWSGSCLKNCGHANNIYGFTRPVVYHNHIQYKHSLQCHFVGNKTWMKIESFISGHIMNIHYCLFPIISCVYWHDTYYVPMLATEHFSQRDLNVSSLTSDFWNLNLLSNLNPPSTVSGNPDIRKPMKIVLLVYTEA